MLFTNPGGILELLADFGVVHIAVLHRSVGRTIEKKQGGKKTTKTSRMLKNPHCV